MNEKLKKLLEAMESKRSEATGLLEQLKGASAAEYTSLSERHDKAMAEFDAMEVEAESLKAEGRKAIKTLPDGIANSDDDLMATCRFENFLKAAISGQPVSGAERELIQERGMSGDPSEFPLDMLAPLEKRVDAATAAPADVQGNAAPILGAVFRGSIVDHLGVTVRPVSAGDSVYHVMTSQASVGVVAKGVKVDAAASTLTPTTLKPVRVTGKYQYAVEDAARVGSLETALRTDMQMAIAEKISDIALNGDNATTPQPDGFLNALTIAAAGSSADTFVSSQSKIFALLDGRYASDLSDLAVLFGAQSAGHLASLYQTNSDTSALSAMRAAGVRIASTSLIPAVSGNSQVQNLVVAKRKGLPGAAVLPVWLSARLIRDEITGADTGTVNLTWVVLMNFALLRSANFAALKLKIK